MGKAKDDFNPHLRQAVLGVVDNQLRENDPPETRETLARLIKEGYSEAEAILGVLALCESGETELIGSDVLLFEAARSPQPVRRRYAFAVLSRAKQFVPLESGVVERARIFQSLGIKPVDALHLASAVEAKADYFCTCDDKFLNRAKAVDTLQTKVVSPLELITEVAR